MTNIGAGVDTVIQSLAAVIAGVTLNKSVHNRLQDELESAVADEKISRGEPVLYKSASQMEYLQACIREAMRVWPDIAIALPRVVSCGGIELDGHYIPEDYIVGMNPRQLARARNIFGSDFEAYRPERWLHTPKEQRNDMEMYNLAFGGPSRKCSRMRLAYLILSKVLASLFINLELKALNMMKTIRVQEAACGLREE
ncbi:hypothetical protein LTR49_028595, partial [Elasticomyces elasticus]